MRFLPWNLCLVALLGWANLSVGATHTDARLVLAADTVRPGESVEAGILLRMEQGWHTYWKNSGASGMPTSINWDLPPGVTAGEILWPLPEKLPDEDLTTYIYKDQVMLLVPLKVAPSVSLGPLTLKARVSWLECEVQCLPGDATVEAILTVGSERKASPAAAQFDIWQKKLPQKPDGLSARALWDAPPPVGASGKQAGGANAGSALRPLVLEWVSPGPTSNPDFFPYASDTYEVQPGVESVASEPGKVRIRKQVKTLSGAWPTNLTGILVQASGQSRQGWEVNLPIEAPAGVASATLARGAADRGGLPAPPPLWQMLLYAFIGGLILNIMPCVLPVIALKILGFVNQARDEPGRVRRFGLVYALGVLVSFLALASLVIGVKAAGHRAGWGMQFGNPQFLVVLTVLVTLVALNLFGVFEVNPGGRVMNAAGTLASRHGAAGSFFNGVLATILATPCTAPFLGAALGFAFTQSAGTIVLMFTVVAAGLAAPYVLLSWNPGWLKFVPKPGAWMERFKVAMGFPMLATAVWLFSLLPLHYGRRAWWMALFLVVVACAAWVYGEFVQRGRAHRGLAGVAVILIAVGGYAYAIEGQLRWRTPEADNPASTTLRENPEGIPWQPWRPEAVAAARAAGRPVLVDFTADWCLTCQANKKFALEVPEVRNQLKSINAVALLGDYTRLPENITVELNRYGRAGVPLVLVYPKRASEPPMVLPEALTPGLVLEALKKAAL